MSDNLSKAGIALSELEGWAGKHARLGQGRMGLQGSGLWDLEKQVQERRKEIESEVKSRRETVMNLLRELEDKNLELSEELAHAVNNDNTTAHIEALCKLPEWEREIVAEWIKDGGIKPERRGTLTPISELQGGDVIDVYPGYGDPIMKGLWEQWKGSTFVKPGSEFRNVKSSEGVDGFIEDSAHKVYLVERPKATMEDLEDAPTGAMVLETDDAYAVRKRDDGDWDVLPSRDQNTPGPYCRIISTTSILTPPQEERVLVYP